MADIARDERSWTLRTCPICGAATVDPDDYVCQCVCALEAVEVVPATQLRGAVDALRECRDALRERQVSGQRWRSALASAAAILDDDGGR